MFPKFMTPPNKNGYRIVIASPDQVRGFSTRNPVVAQHWIPDPVRDDIC
jgi:hypothetical protein